MSKAIKTLPDGRKQCDSINLGIEVPTEYARTITNLVSAEFNVDSFGVGLGNIDPAFPPTKLLFYFPEPGKKGSAEQQDRIRAFIRGAVAILGAVKDSGVME